MKLKHQKKLAAKALGVGLARIWLDPSAKDELKEAITKADVLGLMDKGIIKVRQIKGISRHRAIARHKQRMKGRQRGHGRRKGAKTARTQPKREWINKVRLQRKVIKELRNKKGILPADYRKLYKKVKGGVFRSKRHLLQVIEQTVPKVEKKESKTKQEVKKTT